MWCKKIIIISLFLCLVGSVTSFADIVYENDYEAETVGDGFPAWNWGGGAATHETAFANYEGSIVVEHTAVVNNTSGGAQNSRIGSNFGITLSGNTSSNPADYWIAFDIKNVSGDWDPIPFEVWVLPGGEGYGSDVVDYAMEDGWIRVIANLGDMTRTWWNGANWDSLRESDWTLEIGMPWPGESVADGVSFDQVLLIDNLIITMGEEPPSPATQLATRPSPQDGDEGISVDVGMISWNPGEFADTHNVFFGTDVNSVTDATTDEALGTTSYEGLDVNSIDLARLAYGTTYYWRVDEVNAPSAPAEFKGKVWSFTTEPEGIALVYPEQIVDVTVSSASADSGEPNTVVNEDGLNENDEHSNVAADMWQTEWTVIPGGAWMQFEFDNIYKLHEILVWNYNAGYPGTD